MPIHCPIPVRGLTAEQFERIDYRVMGHAYASQNELGRLCDEAAYQADLKARLLADGFRSVQTEIPVTVEHRDFIKRYFVDLLVDDALYELKVDADLTGEHEAQLLNYAFLLGVPRGKLLNFRPAKVQGRLVAAGPTQEDRRRFTCANDGEWTELTATCGKLRNMIGELLADWGAYLQVSLYQEALVHLLGDETMIEHRVRLARGTVELGSQRMFLHAPGVAFRLTAITQQQSYFEAHLRRLLALTDLKAIQWINLNHSQIEFTTLQNTAGN
jgi:GxxExxY protein